MATTVIGGQDWTYSGNWILWRTKADAGAATADTDYVDDQSSYPPASELFPVGVVKHPGIASAGIQILPVWIDNAGEVLDPNNGTTRGTFDLEILEVAGLLDDDSPRDAVDVTSDSAKLTSCQGFTQYVIELPAGKYWCRVTAITAPTSGNPTKLQLWVKPFGG